MEEKCEPLGSPLLKMCVIQVAGIENSHYIANSTTGIRTLAYHLSPHSHSPAFFWKAEHSLDTLLVPERNDIVSSGFLPLDNLDDVVPWKRLCFLC